MKFCYFSCFFLLLSLPLQSQGLMLPPGNPGCATADRLSILSDQPAPFFSSLKGWERQQVTQFAVQSDSSFVRSPVWRRNLDFLYKDNNEWLISPDNSTTLGGRNGLETPSAALLSQKSKHYFQNENPFWGLFYPTPAHFLEVNQPDFYLRLNPILHLGLGKEQDTEGVLFYNRRGLELRGGVDNRVYFYTHILETQASFPNYVDRRIDRDQALPGEGFYKNFESSLFNTDRAFDFLNAQGYVGFNVTPHIGMQLGYGRHFIGNGLRSLLLSDFSNNYFYLKFNTQVWKIHYQNLFTEMSAASSQQVPGDELLPKKYMAAHYLGFRVNPSLEIGLYEAVVFNRDNGFELQYLNPLIFYRAIEQAVGSPDNVLLGLDWKADLWHRMQWYGQLVFDEFKIDELLFDPNGWWGNKFGFQTGLKYLDLFGIDHLDVQVEYNQVRPYTYTHRDSSASYTHYNQPLAHPLGANLEEVLVVLRYQPLPRLTLSGRALWMNYGEDGLNANWGNNILVSSDSRVRDFDNEIGQGIATETLLLGGLVSYELFHHGFLELEVQWRDQQSDLAERSLQSFFIGGGLRMNISRRNFQWTGSY